MSGPSVDVALISLGTTPGLRRSDAAFAEAVRAAGVDCELVPVELGATAHLRRQMTLTDFIEARAARRASASVNARAVVFSTVTTALLARVSAPYAVRFDAPAALNRPGIAGSWQRARERRVLDRADLLLPASQAAAEAVTAGPTSIVLPPEVEDRGSGERARSLAAVAYAGNPEKRGLALLCAAWTAAAGDDDRLVVGGIDRKRALSHLRAASVPEPPRVDWAGLVPREEWLETVGTARVFVNASRYEDFGLAQLEALSGGAALVTVPSAGPYEALALARAVAPELVAGERSAGALAQALRTGLALDDRASADYARRARELLSPYRPGAVRAAVRERVLPALGIEPA